jgi:hypothetical protein
VRLAEGWMFCTLHGVACARRTRVVFDYLFVSQRVPFLMVFKNIRVPLFSNELPHTFFMFSWWIGTSSLVLDYINKTH